MQSVLPPSANSIRYENELRLNAYIGWKDPDFQHEPFTQDKDPGNVFHLHQRRCVSLKLYGSLYTVTQSSCRDCTYAVKNGAEKNYDFISDFGFYVEDPCQAFDNKLNINLNPTSRTVKDLKYHDGPDSQFWLTNTLSALDPNR